MCRRSGALPSELPSLSAPSFDPETWRRLFPTALALTSSAYRSGVDRARRGRQDPASASTATRSSSARGFRTSSARSARRIRQSGSFNRSGVNYEAGAKTPLARVFFGDLCSSRSWRSPRSARYLPLAVMAALLFVGRVGLIDMREMRRIARTNRGEALVLGGDVPVDARCCRSNSRSSSAC
jgi:SulP family sulfate permease